jgi:hypothetical protein
VRQSPGSGARQLWFVALLLLGAGVERMEAQDRAPRIAISIDSSKKTAALVRTYNLLEDTPWLTVLRQGLPVRLRYRIDVWRSRQVLADQLAGQYEWQVVLRNQPLLDQFTLYRIFPNQKARSYTYATSGALAASLGNLYSIPFELKEEGIHYYSVSLRMETLSDSDLDDFNRALRGEIVSGGGGSLAERAKRLALKLAGLPTLELSGESTTFEVK